MQTAAPDLDPIAFARQKPIYGQSYGQGWIGFTLSYGIVSDAIAYGERWVRKKPFPAVSHAFVVVGPDACVEAHIDGGVRLASISTYLTDPKCKVYFREPLDLKPAVAACIAIAAKNKVGSSYDDLLIAEQALSDSLAGHWLNRLLGGLPHRVLSAFLARPREFICSYLAAYAVASQPQYAGRGCLAGPLSAIDPQTLFEAEFFEPFVNDCSLVVETPH